MGCHISVVGNRYRIFWPQRSVELFSSSVNSAIEEMRAVQNIIHFNPDFRVVTNHKDEMVTVFNHGATRNSVIVGCPRLPTDIWATIEAGEDKWVSLTEPEPEEEKVDELTHINGVPINGAVAFKEGAPAADCPYPEESEEFARWNDEWDDAADKSELPPVKGSVVTNRYRANYSEQGHPTHCGDELAILLNNLCLNKAGVNIQLFEEICEANGIKLTRYNRTTRGWQGRLRMTGRNLLTKHLKNNGGVLIMPQGFIPESYKLSEDWVASIENKYKPKT
jgi:hypothetical protein